MSDAKSHPHPKPLQSESRFRARILLVCAFVLLGLSRPLDVVDRPLSDWLARLTIQLALATFAWAFVAGIPWPDARTQLGWGPSRLSRDRQIFAVLVGVSLLAVTATLVGGPAPAPPVLPFTSAFLGKAALFLSLVILPTLCEETFFRGVLQNFLTPRIGAGSAILVGSLLFAALHLSAGPWVFAFGFTVGVCLGALVHQSGSTREAMWIHGVNNAAYFVSSSSS